MKISAVNVVPNRIGIRDGTTGIFIKDLLKRSSPSRPIFMRFLYRGCRGPLEFICPAYLHSTCIGQGAAKCWTSSCSPSAWAFLRCRSATSTPATGCEEHTMTFDYTLAAIVTAGLLLYLTYALLHPEGFWTA